MNEKYLVSKTKEKISAFLKPLRVVTLPLTLATALAVSAPAAGADNQSACQFVFGAQTIHSMVPDIVGDCTDNQVTAPSGDAQQHTVNGTIYYKKADNLWAFHNTETTYMIDPKDGRLINVSDYFSSKIDPTFSQDQRHRLISELSMIPVNAPLVISVNYLSPDTYNGLNVKYPDQIPQAMSKLGSKRLIEHFDTIDSIVLGPTSYTDNKAIANWVVLSNGKGRIVFQPDIYNYPLGYLTSTGVKELVGAIVGVTTLSGSESEDISFGTVLEYDKVNFPPVTSRNIITLRSDALNTPGQSKFLAYLDSLLKVA